MIAVEHLHLSLVGLGLIVARLWQTLIHIMYAIDDTVCVCYSRTHLVGSQSWENLYRFRVVTVSLLTKSAEPDLADKQSEISRTESDDKLT